jgi:hypothetical protein
VATVLILRSQALESYPEHLFLILGVVLELIFWMPIFYGLYLAIRGGKEVKGRWLFVLVSPALVFTVLFGIPILLISIFSPLAIFVVPAFKQILQHTPWWTWLAEYFVKYWWIGFLPVLFVSNIAATFLVNSIWKRWPALFDALVGKPRGESEASS